MIIMNDFSKKLVNAKKIHNEEKIIARRYAEEALPESEIKYRNLIENSQDGIFIIQDAKIQYANEAFARMAGYTVEEVVGEDFHKFVAPEDLEMVEDRYYQRQAGENVPKEYEFCMIHKDGKTRIKVNVNVGLITSCNRVASMGTVKDINGSRRIDRLTSPNPIQEVLEVEHPLLKVNPCIEETIKNHLEIIILKMLSDKKMCGFDLIKEIYSRYNVLLSPGTVYPFLYTLEEKGILQIEPMKGNMRTKLYSVTEDGMHIFEKKLNEFIETEEYFLKSIKKGGQNV